MHSDDDVAVTSRIMSHVTTVKTAFKAAVAVAIVSLSFAVSVLVLAEPCQSVMTKTFGVGE